MAKKMDEVEFTIFDTETTGLDPASGDRIIEIAAVRLKGKHKLGEFESLVNPKRPVSEAAFEVNKITAEMLKTAPDMETVLPEFMDFIKGSCICSYNAVFDIAFLKNEIMMARQKNNGGYFSAAIELLQKSAVVDILKMSRRLLPGLNRYALWYVAKTLGLNIEQQHRAFSDVEITRGVFEMLSAILKKKGIDDFDVFLSLFGCGEDRMKAVLDEKIVQITRAIDQGMNLKIRYLSGTSARVSERAVTPKTIKRERNHSYLIGYCYLRNEERIFKIDNIVSMQAV